MLMPAGLLANKSAIITGGTTGIGRAICLEYLRQGCNVVVNHLGLSQDEPHVRSLEEEAEALKTSSSPPSLAGLGADSVDVGSFAHLAGDVRDRATGPALVRRAVE